eukprot:5548682-Karenia_brevis.AAC.1
MPGRPSQSYGPMGGSLRSTLRRQPTVMADPPPVAETGVSEASVAAEIAADLDQPNILPGRRQVEPEPPVMVASDDE